MGPNEGTGIRHLVGDGIHYDKHRVSYRDLRAMRVSIIKKNGLRGDLTAKERKAISKAFKLR